MVEPKRAKMIGVGLKLKLILWKNYIVRKQHKKLTFFQICLPFLIFGICVLKSSIPDIEPRKIDVDTYNDPRVLQINVQNIYYAPNKTDINKFMKNIKSELSPEDVVQGFVSEYELMRFLKNEVANHTYFSGFNAAVIFEEFTNTIPWTLKYTIRTDMSIDVSKIFSTYPYESQEKKQYFQYPFLSVQYLIEKAYIQSVSPIKVPEITLEEMPFPPHLEPNPLTDIINAPASLVLIIIFMLLYVDVVKRTLEDKISGMKELMKIVGMEVWMLWLGWFIYIISISLFTFLVTTIFFTVNIGPFPALLTHINFFLMFVFLFTVMFATIAFSFFICAVFSNVSFGTSAAFIIWTINYGLASYLSQAKVSLPGIVKYGILIFPASGLPHGMTFIFDYDRFEKDLGWSEIFTSVNGYSTIPTLGLVMLMNLVSALIFMLLAWYIDLVFPGEFGIGYSPFFLFKKSFWVKPTEDKSGICLEPLVQRPEVEKVPPTLRAGIQIRNLEKNFANKKAVDNLNMDIYHNELTVLLGHNGAGKTTTINIITGMTSLTKGRVLVDGYNIQTDIHKVRESLGFCPQHNIHFPDLTVIQHMKFFAMLKGLPQDEALRESRKFLAKLNIADKEKKLASTLSGGQKRRLSLGMALVGCPQVLMLDEPTSGLDPEARREIWDFLLSMRGEHTILITTHYMEEADVLGDRIAIMHEGHLQCHGTSLFLKKYYGTGYVMNILMNNKANIDNITTFIRSHVDNATTKYVSTSFAVYTLPSSNTKKLSELFDKLEHEKKELGINSFGVSITTLEDVFLRVGELAIKTKEDNDTASSTGENSTLIPIQLENSTSADQSSLKMTFLGILPLMCWALLEKRFHYVRHNLIKFSMSILVPLVIILVFCLIPTNVSVDKDIKRELTLSAYPGSETFYSFEPEIKSVAGYFDAEIRKQGSKPIETSSVSNSILGVGHNNTDEYYSKLIVAAEFNSTKSINLMYGNMPFHGPAIALNLLSNTLLKQNLKYKSGPEPSISVTNKPLSLFSEQAKQAVSIGSLLLWAVSLPLLFVSMHSSWLNYPQDETLSGVKHLQIMAGVPALLYWLLCYVIDILLHFLFCLVMMLFMYFIMASDLYTWAAVNVFLVLCLMYALAAFPLMYTFTRLKSNTTTQYVLLALSFLTGLFGLIAVLMLQASDHKSIGDTIDYILSFSPFFTLAMGMKKWFMKSLDINKWTSLKKDQKENMCKWSPVPCCLPDSEECQDFMSYYASDNDMTDMMLWMTGQTFLYWAILMLFEFGYPQMLWDKLKEKRHKSEVQMDDDVRDEINRVQSKNPDVNSSDLLLVKDLQKWYGKLHAVRGLSFGVQKGECFGLLGVNGAGKTTTFKMLTNEIHPSNGSVFLQDLKLPIYSYLKKLGYCPQIDALNLSLTGRELLRCFARIRGIRPSLTNGEVDRWLHSLDIMQYADKLSRTYSGGNKRKLNTAIALIGSPPLVMLDEPTSGVDPASRRKIWDILCEIRKLGQSVVLTSHSMEECEALCDRLTIMVDGQMHCIGPIQKLKEKYGKGFTIMMKLKADATPTSDHTDSTVAMASPMEHGNMLKRMLEQQYVCHLKDEHHGMLLYHIESDNTSLARIFTFMESLKDKHGDLLEDFVVSDASLEQVFLSFAKKRDETARATAAAGAAPPVSRAQYSRIV